MIIVVVTSLRDCTTLQDTKTFVSILVAPLICVIRICLFCIPSVPNAERNINLSRTEKVIRLPEFVLLVVFLFIPHVHFILLGGKNFFKVQEVIMN